MKKLFFSQNKISYLIINKIIKDSRFDFNDCIIITYDNHSNPHSSIRHINSKKYQLNSKIIFPLSWKELRKKKSLLNHELCLHEPFVFFNTNYSLWICTYLHNHPNCQLRNFVESGTSAYFTLSEYKHYYDFRFKFNVKHYLLRTLIWLNHYFSHTINPHTNLKKISACDVVYSLSDKAFEHPNVQVVKDIFRKVSFVFTFEIVWAPTALTTRAGSIERSDLIHVYDKVVLLLINRGFSKILVKLHPRETEQMRLYFNQLKNNTTELDIIIADNSLSVENILYSIDVPLLTDTSSLALYAKVLNRQCYSYYNQLCEISKMFHQRFVIKPAILKNSLIDIDHLPSPNAGSRK